MSLMDLFRKSFVKSVSELSKYYFQMEVLGVENLPDSKDENCMYVMNHTAFFSLESYLISTFLINRDPNLDIYTLVWKRFFEGPLAKWFKEMKCETATIENGAKLLAEGKNVFTLPEGTDATDIRNELNIFHTGYLRMIKKTPKKIIPIGFYGVDKSIPWFLTTNKHVVKKMMEPMNIGLDFYIFPKLPVFRPVKIVFNIGKPITLTPAQLKTENKIKTANEKVKNIIKNLVEISKTHRENSINSSVINKVFHKIIEGKHTILPPPF
jgi:1-acyl-sn-glycerol-3-phosphate acyltransferase